MDARDSRAEYERRIHRVMAHVDQHLGEALDLPTLASITERTSAKVEDIETSAKARTTEIEVWPHASQYIAL